MALGRIHLDNLALDATLSGGSWGGTLDNVQDPRITSLPARCADASDLDASQFQMAWDAPVYVTDLLLAGHFADLDSRYRVTAYEGETELFQTDWADFYGAVYQSASLPWEQGNWWTGKPPRKLLQAYARHLPIRLPSSAATDRMVVELDVQDVAAAEEDFDLGYVMATSRLAPGWNYTWGRELAIVRRTLEEVTVGGRRIKARRTNARRHSVTFPSLTKEEAMALFDRAMQDDEHPVYFEPDADDEIHGFREVFPATMGVASPPRQVDETGDWSITLSFEELQG